MFRLKKWPPWAAVIAGAFMLGTAGPARADILLNLTDTTTGGSTGNLGGAGNSVSYSGAVGDFSVSIAEGSSNSPGGPYKALTQQGTVTITNNGASAETLQILVSANGFTSPQSPPPLNVSDTVSGSVLTGTLTNGSAQGFADASNTLGGEGFAGAALSFGPTTGGTNNASFSQSGVVDGFSPNGSPYSLTFIETFTLSAGGSITVTGGNVEAVVPEPANMMAALSAVPFLALGAWLRRRKQVAIA
jgi:hypothetical protein